MGQDDSEANLTDHAFEVDAEGNHLTGSQNKKLNDVRGLLGHRIQNDPNIIDRARELFVRDVRGVLGNVL